MRHPLLVPALVLMVVGCKPADEKEAEACVASGHGAGARGKSCLPVCVTATSTTALKNACGTVQLESGICADAWKQAHPGGKPLDDEAKNAAWFKSSDWTKNKADCKALCGGVLKETSAASHFTGDTLADCQLVDKATD